MITLVTYPDKVETDHMKIGLVDVVAPDLMLAIAAVRTMPHPVDIYLHKTGASTDSDAWYDGVAPSLSYTFCGDGALDALMQSNLVKTSNAK